MTEEIITDLHLNQDEILRNKTKYLLEKGIFFEKTYKEETVEDGSKNITHASIKTFPHVVLAHTHIREMEKVLRTYSRRALYDGIHHISHYVIVLDTDKYFQKEFITLLNRYCIKTLSEINYTYHSKLKFYPTKSNPDLTWIQRRRKIEEELGNIFNISYTSVKTPLFPLFIVKDKNKRATAEEFINSNIPTPPTTTSSSEDDKPKFHVIREFEKQARDNHILLNTQVFRTSTDTIYITGKDWKQINFVKKPQKKRPKSYVKDNEVYTFDFTNIQLDTFRTNYKYQRVEIPLFLLKSCFSQKNLTKDGLRFLLLVLFSYHARFNLFNYKVSTIVKLAQLNTTKSKAHTVQVLNKYFNYLQQINMIPILIELSLNDLLEDSTIKIFLNPLSKLKL